MVFLIVVGSAANGLFSLTAFPEITDPKNNAKLPSLALDLFMVRLH